MNSSHINLYFLLRIKGGEKYIVILVVELLVSWTNDDKYFYFWHS